MIVWIMENKEWIFSGIGILLISYPLKCLLLRLKRQEHQEHQEHCKIESSKDCVNIIGAGEGIKINLSIKK